MYENGQGVKKDTEESFAAVPAAANTDRCRRKQLSVKSTELGKASRLITKKRRMYRRAIEQGETRCATRLERFTSR